MNLAKYFVVYLGLLFLSPLAYAQDRCDWYGRDVYPICENKQTGWSRENGKKCISRDECVNGQPPGRGGIIDGGNNGGGNNGGGNNSGGGSVDQCNTTAQCQAVYGARATDCLNSASRNSVCMCGNSRCDGGSSGGSSSSSGGGSGSSGEIVYSEGFERYRNEERWRNISSDVRVKSNCGRGGGKCLRVSYRPASNGSARLQTKISIPARDHYRLSYDIYFENGFEFVKGGKLPGLSPANHTTGCRPEARDKWSARLMWRPDGRIQTYYYGQGRPTRCGESTTSSPRILRVGRWHKVDVETKINSRSNRSDGFMILKVDGQTVAESKNIKFRGSVGGETRINRFFFSTFYGGSNRSWAPSKTTYARFDNFKIEKVN